MQPNTLKGREYKGKIYPDPKPHKIRIPIKIIPDPQNNQKAFFFPTDNRIRGIPAPPPPPTEEPNSQIVVDKLEQISLTSCLSPIRGHELNGASYRFY